MATPSVKDIQETMERLRSLQDGLQAAKAQVAQAESALADSQVLADRLMAIQFDTPPVSDRIPEKDGVYWAKLKSGGVVLVQLVRRTYGEAPFVSNERWALLHGCWAVIGSPYRIDLGRFMRWWGPVQVPDTQDGLHLDGLHLR